LLTCVAVVGWNVGSHFGTDKENFYATVSQVIATLFIAIFLGSYSNEHPLGRNRLDRAFVLTLLAVSLFGIFACVRGLLGRGDGLMTGLAAAGLVACFLLVALALVNRIHVFNQEGPRNHQVLLVVFLFLIATLTMFVYLP
jgi:hypothetical protein